MFSSFFYLLLSRACVSDCVVEATAYPYRLAFRRRRVDVWLNGCGFRQTMTRTSATTKYDRYGSVACVIQSAYRFCCFIVEWADAIHAGRA